MTIFSSFRSTVSGWVRGPRAGSFHVLEDPNTGAPVGLQNRNANGADGIWAPVDLTAAQIAAPTAAMIADLNAEYRLNVAPYTRYRSDGTTLVEWLSGTVAGELQVGNPSLGTAQVGIAIAPNAAYNLYVLGPARTVKTWADPAAEVDTNYTLTTYLLASRNNANDVLNIIGVQAINSNGFHCTSQHSSGIEGLCYGADTTTGTVDWCPGVVGNSGNQGAGTVTNAVDFLSHNVLKTSTGAVTNHYGFYHQTASGTWGNSVAANEYGGFFNAPTGFGTTAPVYAVDDHSGVGINTTTGYFLNGGVTITSGAGAPSGTQPNGSLWLRTDGGANTRLYVSEGGGTWAAITSA